MTRQVQTFEGDRCVVTLEADDYTVQGFWCDRARGDEEFDVFNLRRCPLRIVQALGPQYTALVLAGVELGVAIAPDVPYDALRQLDLTTQDEAGGMR